MSSSSYKGMSVWSLEQGTGDAEPKKVNREEEEKVEEEEEDYVIQFDEKTNLPIRHLEYNETPVSDRDLNWLKNGRHLDFTLMNNNKGYLFLNSDVHSEKGTTANQNPNVNLFPFDLLPSVDHSEDYYQFMKNTCKEFELLLQNRRYKYYSTNITGNQEFGVLNLIKEEVYEKKLHLRSLMTICLENLNNLIKCKSIEDEWIVNYANCLNILNLINAIYISDDDETIVLLQNWIQTADIEPDEATLKAAVIESEKPYQNFSFWSVYVKKMITRGCFGNLIEDIKSSQYEELENSDNQLYVLIENFMSLLSGYDPITFSLDLNSFLNWKEVAVGLRDSTAYMNVKNQVVLTEIRELLGILSGLTQTIESSCESWYECFTALYLYQLPSKSKIQEYLDNSLKVDQYNNDLLNGVNTWDSICIDVLKGRFLSVISGTETLDKFIATFTGILMEASGLLNSYTEVISTTDILERKETTNNVLDSIDSMLNDLAMSLLNDDKFFDVGVGILIEVNDQRTKSILGDLLPSYKIQNTEDFEWILSICIKLGLYDTMETIYKTQGELLFEKGYLYESLYCFTEAKADTKIIEIIWKIFEITLVDGKINDQTLVEKIERNEIESPILRHALSPLVCLNEILNGDNDNIAIWFERCIKLLNFKYLPNCYKPGLILIVYPYLNKNVLSVDNYLELITSLNAFEVEFERDQTKCEMMYQLLLDSKSQRSIQLKYDWDSNELPANLSALLKGIRKTVATQLSFSFLEDL